MASKRNGTLYTGVTSNLMQRIYEHKEGTMNGFSKRYNIKTLVYFEPHDTMEHAIHREKRLKKYTRAQKIRLIESINPEWRDLYDDLF